MSRLDLTTYLEEQSQVQSDEKLNLGNTSLRIMSNITQFKGGHFFSRAARLPGDAFVDEELYCIDDPEERIRSRIRDRPTTYRAKCFLNGYYATDHFGEPVSLIVVGNKTYVVGRSLENVFWPYLVKWFIFKSSISNPGEVFLKAALVALEDQGILIVGRSGGGKSTLVEFLCENGGHFVSNSHVIARRRSAIGVLSNIRVRSSAQFEEHGELWEAIRPGEVLVDPLDKFPIRHGRLNIDKIIITDYGSTDHIGIKHVESKEAIEFLECFSLGLNVYRLEEDLLEYLSGNIERYSDEVLFMKNAIRILVNGADRIFLRADVNEPKIRRELLRFCRRTK